MKTFTFKEEHNNWVVTTTLGEAYVTELSPIQFYAKELNDLHNLMLEDLLKRKNYLSLGEVQLWIEDSIYGSEATQIINWYKSTYRQITDHLKSITEYKDPSLFIKTLSILY
jgi:hypothetical protein